MTSAENDKGRKRSKLKIAAGLLYSVAKITMRIYIEGEEPKTPETQVETPSEEKTEVPTK